METKQHATKQSMGHWKVKEEIKNYLETSENGNTVIQNLWDEDKTVLRGKFIVIQAYFMIQEKSQTIKMYI